MIRSQEACAAVLCALAAASASADSLQDRIIHHNDVLHHRFVVDEVSDLVAWTNSYRDGENFDPIVALWLDGHLLAQVDDYPYIAPDQTRYDSGFRLYGLQPGTYEFTIGTYSNFANSGQLGDGFQYDGDSPIPLADWCQPASHCGMGPSVTLNWALTPAVPEPATGAMLGVGLALTGLAIRRRARMDGPRP